MKREDIPITVELLELIKKWNLDRSKIHAPGSECYGLQCLIIHSENELFGEDTK